MKVDVLVVGDFRFGGGTSSAIAAEVRALLAAGYAVGLLPAEGQVLRYPHPFHPDIVALIDDGRARLVGQGVEVETKLCLLHHPQVFSAYPVRPWRIAAEQTLLIVHHPPLDAVGTPNYDWRSIARIVREVVGPHRWAPVGPKVRAQFAAFDDPPELTIEDWSSVIDVEEWTLERGGFLGARPVIGRHSRPDPLKWPDDAQTFLQAYPDDPDIEVRLLGYSAGLDAIVGQRPANWRTFAFGTQSVRTFLGGIDFFVYFHGSLWVEAFGRSILEAAASGAVAILPAHFEPLFGDAALYCEPADVRSLVFALHRRPIAFQRQSARGIEIVRDRFGPNQVVARVERRIGGPEAYRRSTIAPQTSTRVVFLTSNGIGMGHLVRALAVARRLPETIRPVVVSMSRAFGVTRFDGVHCEHLPFFRSVGLDERVWNDCLEAEISEMLAFYDPAVFVLDANVPYPGLVRALERWPQIWKVWQRRAMWPPGAGERHLALGAGFDAVIEPGEMAGAMDRGATTAHRARTVVIPQIGYLTDGEALDRSRARSALGLPDTGLAVLLQLGSGNNFDLSLPRDRAVAQLGAIDGLHIVSADWIISDSAPQLPERVRRVQIFPIARYLAAFDFAIAAAGYNTFHENIAAGLPTIFVPNCSPEQDEQWVRARYAELRGLALTAAPDNLHALDAALRSLLHPEKREALRSACSRMPGVNGAEAAARYIAHLASMRRYWKEPQGAP